MFYDAIRTWWSGSGGLGMHVLARTLGIVGVVVLARLALFVANRAIAVMVRRRGQAGDGAPEHTRRWRTVEGLLRNVVYYATGIVALVMVLDLAGIPVQGVLAGVGILGLAVGFGAQNLVRDVLSGFFLLYEDVLGVGDYVSIAGYSGTVEAVGLRTTTLRGDGGELYVIPNGLITDLKNFSRRPLKAMVTVTVDPGYSVDSVRHALEEACQAVEDKDLLEPAQVLGVVDFTELGLKWMVTALTGAMARWRVERLLRAAIREALDRHGIKIATWTDRKTTPGSGGR